MNQLRVVLVVVVTAVLSALGAVVPAAHACACGAFVAPDGLEVEIDRERVVLAWDGETERMVLSVDALTEAADAALLIPTPAPAEAALADDDIFDELEALIAPELVVEYRWWPDSFGFGFGDEPDVAVPGSVTVIETTQLGPLEVAVLSAEDANQLTEWLNEHGYVMGDGVASALMPYVAEGWYYVAVRLTTEAENLSGALQPIDLSFASEQLVYPMRLSAASADAQRVRTYVFADQQVQRTDETASSTPVDLRFAGSVQATGFTSQALAEIATTSGYLTVFDQGFSEPDEQVISDFTFAAAATDTPFRETVTEVHMREIAGVPAGPVLTFAAMVVVLGVVLTLSGLSRRRRRRDRLAASAAG